MIVSVFRVVYILGPDLQCDLSFLVVKVNCGSIRETGIAILIGCGPVIRPVLDKMVPRCLVTWSQAAFTRSRTSRTPIANTKSKTYGKLPEDQTELTTVQNAHEAVSRATITAGDFYNTTGGQISQTPNDARQIGVVREYTVSRV
ncbi:hypothetical protein HYFRA_00012824 [Hymenoscyphus fraxineus]|uniref:Uncharacterized protein n=1 Tax=Hymenoscyphus fraxineus TaxID=746836 RepID=A0A9N9PM02_9HELO|nr:hypothetical protein HYFRA_00012824 [Hymenoscyphus fraxineus]